MGQPEERSGAEVGVVILCEIDRLKRFLFFYFMCVSFLFANCLIRSGGVIFVH